MLGDALLALSLANLCFYQAWTTLFHLTYFKPYFSKDLYPGWNSLALLLDVILLAALFWAGATLARLTRLNSAKTIVRLLFFGVLLVPLSMILQARAIRNIFPFVSGDYLRENLGTIGFPILTGGLVVIFFYIFWRWQAPFTRIVSTLVLLVSPFVLFTFTQGVQTFLQSPAPEILQDKTPASRLPVRTPPAPRVLWMIFDEMGEQRTFERRSLGVELPELEHFRQISIRAPRAYPPATDTVASTSALVGGERILSAHPNEQADLDVLFYSQKELSTLSRYPDIFSKVRKEGLNAAIVGWFQPYCRLFGDVLVECYWEAFQLSGDEQGFLRRMRTMFILMLRSIPWAKDFFRYDPLSLGLFPTRDGWTNIREKYHRLLGRAKKTVADPTLSLIYLHWPIPHWPPIYDRHTGNFEPVLSRGDWYDDNLVLVDETLRQLRESLESAGLWESTTILISSDHHLRALAGVHVLQDSRVPFLLKLAGQTAGVTYKARLQTIVSHDLILGILRGELKTPDQVTKWFDEQREATQGAPAPSPSGSKSP